MSFSAFGVLLCIDTPPTSTYSYHRSTSLLLKFSHCSTRLLTAYSTNHDGPSCIARSFLLNFFKPMNCCRLLAKHDSPCCLKHLPFLFSRHEFLFYILLFLFFIFFPFYKFSILDNDGATKPEVGQRIS